MLNLYKVSKQKVSMLATNILNVIILSEITKTVICLNLESHSFSLRSTINVLENGLNRRYLPKVVVHEIYSAKQFRAQLEYEIEILEQKKKSGKVYFDSLNGITLMHDQTRNECKLTNMNELDKMFGLIDSDLLQSYNLQSRHLLGPARLLLLIDHNKDKMMLANVSVPDSYRNIELSKYMLSHGQLDLTIFYSSSKQRELLENSIPVQVLVKSPNGWLAIDFNQLRLLREDEEELCRLDGDYNFIEADQFALPKVAACVGALKDKMKPLFGNPKMKRISFDSRISQLINDGSVSLNGPDLSVAYDARLHSLRLDTINVRQPSATSLTSARKVVNFKTSRVYQVYEERSLSVVDNQLFKSDCRVLKMYGRGESVTMGYLLAGADFFVHLGRTQVRGQRARLYAAQGAQPAWLEQQLEYTIGDGQARSRDPRQGLVDPNKNDSVTYLYVSEHEMPQLLAMEINNQFGNKILLEFFNFVWQFDNLKWSNNMFSLSEFCSSRESEHYARAELLLERTDQPPWRHVLVKQEQDMALLVALQDFFSLPVNMVYDLETRALSDNRFLFAQFRVATHSLAQMELVYLGRGYPKDGLIGGTLKRVRSFQVCLQSAITSKSNNFGYSIQTQLCFKNRKATYDTQLAGFELEPNGQMEFYRLEVSKKFHLDRDYNSNGRWIERSTRSFSKRQLLGSRVFLRLSDAGLAWFTVKRLQISELNKSRQEKDVTGADGESGEEVDSPDMFEGFALIGEDVNERLLKSRRNSEKKLGEVGSLAQCRWACLSDTNCQSYSACQHRHELQCVTSRLNFRSTNVSRQLRDALRLGARKLVLVQLGNSSEPLQLVRHPSCTLYNKVHLDLFAKKGLYITSASRSQLVGVSGREDCATRCVAMSVKVLAQDSSLSKEWWLYNNRQQVDYLQRTAGSAKKLQVLFDARKLNGLQFCQSFHYIDKSQVDDAKLVMVPGDSVEGFCLFGSRNRDSKLSAKERNETFKATAELYQINLISFYEKQNGLRLKASNVESDVQVLYQKVKIGSALNEEELERLRRLLEAGHNFQEVIYTDEAKCADICFGGAIGQAMRPWPGCRSFDLELDERQPSLSSATRCHLNSMSLEEALLHNRPDLVDETADSGKSLISFSHFELRHGMLAGASAHEQVAGLMKLEQSSQPSRVMALAIVGSFALFCGFLLTHLYDRHLQQRSHSADETTVLEVRAQRVKDASDEMRKPTQNWPKPSLSASTQGGASWPNNRLDDRQMRT